MQIQLIGNHIEAADPSRFRELARTVIQDRGYSQLNESDGWADGGRDLRIFNAPGMKPIKIAFQVSVEKRWKDKLLEDLEKAKKTLGIETFVFVSNRRIPDSKFQPLIRVRSAIRIFFPAR